MSDDNNDLHNNVRTMTVLAPRALATVAGSKTAKIIDRQGYGGVEFIFSFGATGASSAAIPVVVKEGSSATDAASMTSVADGDLLGTEALAGIGLVARTSGTGKNTTRRIGYKGTKQYVTAYIGTVSAALVTAADIFGIVAVLHSPRIAPTTNP